MKFKLNDKQKELVEKLLLVTTTKKDIEKNAEKIMGNVHCNVKTAMTFMELANERMAIKR